LIISANFFQDKTQDVEKARIRIKVVSPYLLPSLKDATVK
jgi:hypothetical protein